MVKTDNKKTKKKKALKYSALAGLIIGLNVIGGTMLSWSRDIPELDLNRVQGNDTPAVFLDNKGEVIAEFSGGKSQTWLSIDEMPQKLKDAFVSVEDKRFYEHNGMDKIRFAKAILLQLTGKRGGGSTITQQLVKNAYLTPEFTLKRKFQELILAHKIEKVLTKDEILEAYLNIIYFGSHNYGVRSAAKDFFGKDINALTTRECAMLAGIINAPTRLNPRRNMYVKQDMSATNDRTNIVLYTMRKNNYITEEEYQEAINEAVFIQEKKEPSKMYRFAHFVEYAKWEVIKDLLAERGLEYNEANVQRISDEIRNKGYQIHTTLDKDIQIATQGVIENWDGYPKLAGAKAEVASVILDSEAHIVAMVGGRQNPSERNTFNRATMSIAPAASTIKPLSTFIPYFEKGYEIGDIEYNLPGEIEGFDENIPYPNGRISEKDWGSFTVKESLKESLNTTTARALFNKVGFEESIEFLQKMGISEKRIQQSGMGLVMGTSGIDVLSLAGAYSTIPRKGDYVPSSSYTKVVDPDGNLILDAKNVKTKTRLFSEKTAFMTHKALEQTILDGTGRKAFFPNMNIAGKTGTHQDRSLLFAGYTPYYTSVVWIGGDNYNRILGDVSGGNTAGVLWKEYMKIIHKNLPNKRVFEKSWDEMGFEKIEVERVSGKPVDPNIKYRKGETYTEYFSKGHFGEEYEGYYKNVWIDRLTGNISDDSNNAFQKRLLVIPTDSELLKIEPEIIKKAFGEFITDQELSEYNDFGLNPEQVDQVIEKEKERAKKEKEKELKEKVETQNMEKDAEDHEIDEQSEGLFEEKPERVELEQENVPEEKEDPEE